MLKSGIAAMIAVAGLAAAANARPGDAFLEFICSDTGDGDGIVEPGESALLTVQCRMVGDANFVAYGGSILNFLTDGSLGTVGSYTIHNGLTNIDPPGDTTILNGEDVENVSTLQLSFGGFTTDNPIDLITFQWDTTDYSSRSVTYSSDLSPSLGVIGVLAKNAKGKIVSENYTGHDGSCTFDVVPAPASMALLGLGGLVASRRRR